MTDPETTKPKWLCSHGATAIKMADSDFDVTVSATGAVVKPTVYPKLSGSVLFPLSGLPRDPAFTTMVSLVFSSGGGRVERVKIMAGSHTIFMEENLRKRSDFTIDILGAAAVVRDKEKGLAVEVTIKFDNMESTIEFESVGLMLAVRRTMVGSLKFCSGVWETSMVRRWDQPRAETEGYVEFPTMFSSPPNVTVGIVKADLGGGTSVRVDAHTTNITARGFKIHGDTWGDTTLYTCGIAWMAVGY